MEQLTRSSAFTKPTTPPTHADAIDLALCNLCNFAPEYYTEAVKDAHAILQAVLAGTGDWPWLFESVEATP